MASFSLPGAVSLGSTSSFAKGSKTCSRENPALSFVARLEHLENRTFLSGAPGSLDSTFGNAGIAESNAPAFAGANGMAVESNGSIVLGLNDGTAVVIF